MFNTQTSIDRSLIASEHQISLIFVKIKCFVLVSLNRQMLLERNKVIL